MIRQVGVWPWLESPLSPIELAHGSAFDTSATTTFPYPAEAANQKRVVLERIRIVDQLREELVVAGTGKFEAIAYRGVLRTNLSPPTALEIEDRLVAVGECHSP